MTNTIDLDPEWGAIDLIEEIEAAFDIKIADHEAEKCWTVGDLHEIISRHTPNWDAQIGSCASLIVFYRIRRTLKAENRSIVSPHTSLELVSDLSPSRLFRKLRKDTNLRLPLLEPTMVGKSGACLCVGGAAVLIAALIWWSATLAAVGLSFVLVGVALMRIDPARFPTGVSNVGELVSRTVPLNTRTVQKAGARASDRWTILLALCAEYGVLPAEQIGPDSFLHKKGLEIASAQR